MNFLEIKFVTPDLLDAVVALDRLCFGELWTLDGYRRELDSPNTDLLVGYLPPSTLSQLDSPVIAALGCSYAILEEAHITILAVHPAYQHQGLGQAMLYALLVAAQHRQLERATLEVAISNQSARSLYEKFGFREAGRRRKYYPKTGEDALILWLNGLHYPEFDQKLADWHREISDRTHQFGWSLSFPYQLSTPTNKRPES